ncbi:glutathione S-transferase N-terminal domain-containing protein [Halopseudomonas pachastrellae]|nr:glutathione S-transferase N-terminal domain-containing protein [Halopseudomonas pachastrellae]WVM91142.1 glutathione S-transferase N-terminal domain-containing protein [Halopseudomonas pachastrellae]
MHGLTLYSNPQSRGRLVHWMLEELQIPYETVWIDYGDEMKSAHYRAINPMGKVPALMHGDLLITECAAICAYLADRFPRTQLAPPVDDPRRAAYLRWLFFAAGPLEQAITARKLDWEVAEGASAWSATAALKTPWPPCSRRCWAAPGCAATTSPPPISTWQRS